MDTIKDKIRSYIIESFLFGEAGSLKDDTSFLTNAIVDSTGMLELINFIEQEYGIALADHELVPQNLDSIDNIAQFVLRKKAEA